MGGWGGRPGQDGPDRLFQGGPGLERRLVVLADCEFSAQFDRMQFAVPGLLGGGEGAPGELLLERPGEDLVRIAGKVVVLRPRAGDVPTVRAQGGGGLGDPRLRDPVIAAADLRLA